MMTVYLDEARQHAIDALANILDTEVDIEKAVLGQDLFGLLRVILWLRPGADEEALRSRISEVLAAAGPFWTGEIWISSAKTSRADQLIYASAWAEGITVPEAPKLRIDDRTRTRTAWLPRFRVPNWEAQHAWAQLKASSEEGGTPVKGPPVIVFYSFKGGVGRTTTLAAFAIQRARQGERVLVIDLDLDAPGAGTLISRDPPREGDEGKLTVRGVVDYLLAAQFGAISMRDYVHSCARELVVGDAEGEILVMPAGSVDKGYLSKLSRLDLEIRGETHPLQQMLVQAREEIEPNWILIDARAGLSSTAGLLLDGIAHLHVLFGTNSMQSQLGLSLVIQNLGEERILRDLPQANCIVVQAMIVDVVEVEKAARSQFQTWLESTMRDHYLVAENQDLEDEQWSVRDIDEPLSPSQAVAIPYNYRLAFFSSIDDVAKNLATGSYAELGDRISGQFRNYANGTGEEAG